MNEAKTTLKNAFAFLNDHLQKQTFLVGERITYADISACLTLRSAFENVLTADFRKQYPSVTRWFMTIINQPGVKARGFNRTEILRQRRFGCLHLCESYLHARVNIDN